MWLLKGTPALLMDLYELTMAQAYFAHGVNERAYFEVTVRSLPPNWGFFVMAGLEEVDSYLKELRFSAADVEFLRSFDMFSSEFLEYLGNLKPDVEIRCLPEGTVFFPDEPVLEIGGPLIHAQLLESCILNILGYSIIAATLAARLSIAGRGLPVMDFGLRRSQGPVAAARAARGAQMANLYATSNVFASRLLGFPAAGTMAHSYVEVHESEEQAFRNFADLYGEKTVLLVDTYDPVEGIKKAAKIASEIYQQKGVEIRGIRIDSGDISSLSRFARQHFKENGVEFLKIFASSGLDEYRIAELLRNGAEVGGFGVGTRFAVSHSAPDIDIVYKIIRYGGRALYKTSPAKHSKPDRKSILRTKEDFYIKDTIVPFGQRPDDLLKTFESPEPMGTIRKRLAAEVGSLPDSVKAIKNPRPYRVEFDI